MHLTMDVYARSFLNSFFWGGIFFTMSVSFVVLQVWKKGTFEFCGELVDEFRVFSLTYDWSKGQARKRVLRSCREC